MFLHDTVHIPFILFQYKMDCCTVLELGIVVCLLVQILRLVFTDCDLQLQWAEKFGKSTGIVLCIYLHYLYRSTSLYGYLWGT